MKLSNNLENKSASDTNWRVQLVYMRVQAHNYLEPPLEYNQDQTPLMNLDLLIFLTILRVTEILYIFKLALEGKTGKELLQ